jgi:hypothetical protein
LTRPTQETVDRVGTPDRIVSPPTKDTIEPICSIGRIVIIGVIGEIGVIEQVGEGE